MLTLSLELFRAPLLLLGMATRHFSLSTMKSHGRIWRISPVRNKQSNPRRTSALMVSSSLARYQPAIARVVSRGDDGARHELRMFARYCTVSSSYEVFASCRTRSGGALRAHRPPCTEAIRPQIRLESRTRLSHPIQLQSWRSQGQARVWKLQK